MFIISISHLIRRTGATGIKYHSVDSTLVYLAALYPPAINCTKKKRTVEGPPRNAPLVAAILLRQYIEREVWGSLSFSPSDLWCTMDGSHRWWNYCDSRGLKSHELPREFHREGRRGDKKINLALRRPEGFKWSTWVFEGYQQVPLYTIYIWYTSLKRSYITAEPVDLILFHVWRQVDGVNRLNLSTCPRAGRMVFQDQVLLGRGWERARCAFLSAKFEIVVAHLLNKYRIVKQQRFW